MISSFNVLRALLSLDTYQHIVDAKGGSLRISERNFSDNDSVTAQPLVLPLELHSVAKSLSENLLKSVLVYSGSHNKTPQMVGLRQQKFVYSWFFRLQVQDQGSAVLFPSEGSLPGL